MIEETVTRFVAAADWTDECQVELRVASRRGKLRQTTLSAPQARELAAELVRAAGEAERAVGELVGPVVVAGFDLVKPVYCSSTSGDGFLCTLHRGHEGVHMARVDPFGEVIAAWGGAA